MTPRTSQRELLAGVAGVWEGTYNIFDVRGRRLDSFASRQECRIDGGQWFERIVYLRQGKEPEVLDFRASFDEEGNLVFDDDRFQGRLDHVSNDILVFVYRWKDRPGEHVAETITLALPEKKTRVWQGFVDGELQTITVVRERRVPDVTPEPWT